MSYVDHFVRPISLIFKVNSNMLDFGQISKIINGVTSSSIPCLRVTVQRNSKFSCLNVNVQFSKLVPADNLTYPLQGFRFSQNECNVCLC